jgi:HSP20 family molecular chaperone IbpA
MRNYNSVWDIFNDILGDDFLGKAVNTQIPRQVKELQCGGFPYSDIYVDQDKSYIIEMALAGVPQENINITTEEGYLYLRVGKEPDSTDIEKKVETIVPIQRGIKRVGWVENSWRIPQQFDITKLIAFYKDGLLKIVVPVKEEVKLANEKREIKLLTE